MVEVKRRGVRSHPQIKRLPQGRHPHVTIQNIVPHHVDGEDDDFEKEGGFARK